MQRYFRVKVTNNAPNKKSLFEREFPAPNLDSFDFQGMIKSLDFLFSDIPHVIVFELTDEQLIFD